MVRRHAATLPDALSFQVSLNAYGSPGNDGKDKEGSAAFMELERAYHRMARRHHPDLILLDLHLPDMRGDEVLRGLKDDPATREIPVVVVSADATRAKEERLLATGARAYLTKPLDVRHFLHVVEAVLT